ncbi:DUF6387 family protein [Kosakonia pseudosacchari]|uniref:Uncharacterized protein n=1 Tax=Kosakonia pseudosacchari TaxID=1646340 RepID=A0ABX4IRZ7_9ENTR|nr:DUF6387 family protein [Kosakonia pseudosacchari]PDO86702.1 hypothetical protein BK796_09595 [Kosakonia pseudosacchari]
MVKKVTPGEITGWLNLTAYSKFYDLTVEEVISEIEFRVMFLIDYDVSDDPELHWSKIRKGLLNEIKSGCILSSEISNKPFESVIDDENDLKETPEFVHFRINGRNVTSKNYDRRPINEELSKGDAITPFTLADLVSYHKHYTSSKHIESIDNTPVVNNGRIFSCVSAVEDRSEYFEDEIVINVNLASFTDDELISEFKELLREWREELDIEEPEPNKQRVGISTIKKIISYRVFPFLDLMLWEMVNQRKISHELAARVLYPLDGDEIVGGQQIKDSIRPFVERIIMDSTLQQLKFYLKKNDYLKNVRLSEVMKISEEQR